MNHSKTIINHIIDENIIEAKKIVTSLISQKAKVHLDDQKRNIAAEMFGGCKTCNEPTLEEGSAEEYKAFFKSALKKFGVSNPAELESDAERKKFFDYVDKNWKGEQAENVEEAVKASPQEDEFLTDLTDAQIAAISPLMKSKNWDKLKAYLMSQKIVDKDFEDIQGYKMDRDVLSVLQRSFKDYHG